MRESVGADYYHLPGEGLSGAAKYIGIDERICKLPQIVFTDEVVKIDDELSLFSGVTGRNFWPSGNHHLKRLLQEEYVQDPFLHEQSLVVQAEGKQVLISGHCTGQEAFDIMKEIMGEQLTALHSGEWIKRH